MNVCKRFIEGLKKHNLTHEEIKSWQYIGGTGGRHDKYFHQVFLATILNLSHLREKDYCICGTAIVEQCWIVDKNMFNW